MNLDFAFRDGIGRLVLAGWSTRRGDTIPVTLDCGVGGERLPLRVLARFVRPDLGPDPLGLLAVVPGVPSDLGPDQKLALLGPDDRRTVIDPQMLESGDEPLIVTGLNETVEAVLRALGRGEIGPLSTAAAARLAERAQATAMPLPRETPRLAVAVDRAIVGPSGLGLVHGWALTDMPVSGTPLLGFVLDGETVAPLGIVPGSVARPDLAALSERYHVSGRDGMVAAFRLPATTASHQASLLFIAADTDVAPGMMIYKVETAVDLVVADAVATMLEKMATMEERAGLLDAIAGGDAGHKGARRTGPAMPDAPLPAGEACAVGAGTLLLVAADCGPEELRDIVRLRLPDLTLPIEVRLVGEGVVPSIGRTIEAIAIEAGPALHGPVIAGELIGREGLARLTVPSGIEVVYGSAAALFQLGLPAAAPDLATALFHDPLAILSPPDTDPGAGVLARHPFTLRLPGTLFAAALAAAPRSALSADGLIAAAMRPLQAADRLRVSSAGSPVFWPGMRGAVAMAAIDLALVEREDALLTEVAL